MKKVYECISLLSSMVSCGDDHSETSRKVIKDAQAECEKLENEVEQLKHILNAAEAIYFPSPDVLERNFATDDGYGKWQFQREWQQQPTTGFETAWEAFEAMQKVTLKEDSNETKNG